MLASEGRKRPTGKTALLAGVCVLILGVSIWGLVAAQVPSSGASSNQGASTAPEPVNVTLSVSCSTAIEAGSATAQAVSDNGAMRHATLRLNAGTTVYEALVASGATLSSSGTAPGVYIAAIDGLPEGEAGPQSGWKYYVNGTAPGVSSDRYVLSNGDVVEWRYEIRA